MTKKFYLEPLKRCVGALYFPLLTTSEAELDYYHQKANARIASRVAERLRKLGSFKKIPKTLGFDGKYPAKFSRFPVKNRKKLAVKHSIEKPFLLNFVNLSPTFCPRL